MKRMLQLSMVAISMVTVTITTASAAVILADDFDGYSTGQVDGESGNADTGSYENTWEGSDAGGFANFTADGRLQINRPSSSFNSGYYAIIDPAGNAGGGNVIYFSATLSLDAGVAGAAFGLNMNGDGNSRQSLIGFNSAGEAAIWNQEDFKDNGSTNYSALQSPTASGSTAFTFGQNYTVIGKIEDAANWSGSNDRVTMWVDPTAGSTEGSNTSEVQLEVGFNGLFPGNSNIGEFIFSAATNNAGESAYLDDLVIGTT